MQVHSIRASLVQRTWIKVLLASTSLVQALPKQVSSAIKAVLAQVPHYKNLKVVTYEKTLSNWLFGSRFLDEIKDLWTEKADTKSHQVKQGNNEKDKQFVLTELSKMHCQKYVQSPWDFHQGFSIQSFIQQIIRWDISFKHIISFMKPLYDMLKISITWFAIYHSHYIEILGLIEFTYNFFIQLSPKISSLLIKLLDYVNKCITHHPHYKYKIALNSTRTLGFAANFLFFHVISEISQWLHDLWLTTTELALLDKTELLKALFCQQISSRHNICQKLFYIFSISLKHLNSCQTILHYWRNNCDNKIATSFGNYITSNWTKISKNNIKKDTKSG